MYESIRIILSAVSIMMISPSEQTPGDYNKKLHSLIKHKVPVITVQELKKELKKEEEVNAAGMKKSVVFFAKFWWVLIKKRPLVLLDTREIKEFKVSHIKNAWHVGYKRFSLKSIADIPKKSPIVVYCSLGVRSERIGEMLKKAGYKKVKNLLGGMFEWVNRGNLVVDINKQPTQQVHAYSKKWGKWLLKGKKVF